MNSQDGRSDAVGEVRVPTHPTRRGWRRTIARLVTIAAATYFGVCLLVGLLQKRLIYFPDRDYDDRPGDVGLPFEELRLRTGDGLTITAWYVPCESAKGTLIYAHGNAGNLSNGVGTMQTFHRLGMNVLAFDYRGFGSSEGSPSEEGTYRDADAAWDHVVHARGEAPERIVLFGRSLGGAVMIDLAHRKSVGALIVEATFTRLAEVGAHHYPLLPIRWMLLHRYDSLAKIGEIRCPKLILHSPADGLVPYFMGRKLFEVAAEPKEFLQTRGGHSGRGFEGMPAIVRQTAEFIDRALNADESRGAPCEPAPAP